MNENIQDLWLEFIFFGKLLCFVIYLYQKTTWLRYNIKRNGYFLKSCEIYFKCRRSFSHKVLRAKETLQSHYNNISSNDNLQHLQILKEH